MIRDISQETNIEILYRCADSDILTRDHRMADKWASRMSVSKELIWSFTCGECKLWWSVAVMDDWKPNKLYCPHCGILEVYEEE